MTIGKLTTGRLGAALLAAATLFTGSVLPASAAPARNSTRAPAVGPDLACPHGSLCIADRGAELRFTGCRTLSVSLFGTGPYVNNQTPGTVARFYGQGGTLLWTSTAYDSGTADWTPVSALRPC